MKTEIKSSIPYATRDLHQMEYLASLGRIQWSKFPKLRKDLLRYVCDEYGISTTTLESIIADFNFGAQSKEELHDILTGLKK